MEPNTDLVADITIALALALAGGWLASRVGLSSIVGYVLAGVAISPFTPGYVGDLDSLLAVADIGIVLLLFGIGAQFSLKDLLESGPLVAVAATAQVAVITGAAVAAGAALGWSIEQSLYLGGAASIASSAVLAKILESQGDVASRFGRLAIAWSIMQDICAVVLIVLLPAVAAGPESAGELAGEAALAVLKALAFVAAVLVLGLRIVPPVFARIAEERSRELFILAIAVLAVATALASEFAGLSLALGAFLAGILVSESDLSHRVLGELLPIRDVFAVLFFTSMGMLLDPGVVASEWIIVAAVAALIVVLKPVVAWLFLRVRELPDASLLTAAMLVSAGEFSFVLGRSGLDEGHLTDDAFTALVAATVVSVVLAPAVAGVAYALVEGRSLAAPGPPVEAPPQPRLGRHAVICGYGHSGQIVAQTLATRFEVLVVETDRRRANEARAAGMNVVEADPVSPTALEHMRLREARMLIITLPDPFATRLLTERARAINPHLDISGWATAASEASKLRRSGISKAAVGEDEAAFELARHALFRFGLSSREALAIVQRIREREALQDTVVEGPT